MFVYRITLARYAGKLTASGHPARWNSRDVHVIYTAESRALACLENVVHRNSRGLQQHFRIMTIEIPGNLKITIINPSDLPSGWQLFENMPLTQARGDKWVKSGTSAVLRVPSVLVPGEHNYILNPVHRDFSKIRYLGNEPFRFDSRIKNG